MNNIKDRIEQYLDGELNPEEVKAIETRLAEDPSMVAALEAAKTARNLITAAGRMELKDTLDRFEEELSASDTPNVKEVKVVPLWIKRAIPIAAMIVVFVGAYWFMLGDQTNSAEVYNKYFETYEGPSVLRDSQNDTPVHWNTAVRYYQEGKYEEALGNFEKAEPEIPEYLVDFYAGLSAMSKENPDYETAIDYLLDVEKMDNDYRQQALWYRGLALVRLGERDKALAVFYQIIEAKSYAYRDAQKIVELDWED